MSIVRRSNLVISISDEGSLEQCWRHGADAITLDLEPLGDAAAPDRRGLAAHVANVTHGGADVFVRPRTTHLLTDLDAAVWPGLAGVVLADLDDVGTLQQVDRSLAELERARGFSVPLQVDLELRSAAGVGACLELASACKRVTTVTVADSWIYADLGLPADGVLDVDPLEIMKGRVVTIAAALGIQALGMSYPLSITHEVGDDARVHDAALNARNLGFKGAHVLHASWAVPCNEGFSPQPSELAHHREVRRVFDEANRRGQGTSSVGNNMLVGVAIDLLARRILTRGEACARKDKEKCARLRTSGRDRHAERAQR
ncbi:MAG: citrate lyase subunit beta / citryl-CoA lyase [Gaiellaceae bacterium]|nr:citrate lyase subunit beta / citryl-CoA lyase [Gaiellaceae bacterium]